jgi:hypothetical protein
VIKAIEFNLGVHTARISPVTVTQIPDGKLEKMRPVGRILHRWEKNN